MSFNMSVLTIHPLADDGGTTHSPVTCAIDRCSHGRCVLVQGTPTCQCKLGYTGDTCNETINEALSIPLILGTLAFILIFIILIFVLAFTRQKQKAKQRKRAAEETLRKNGVTFNMS